MITWITGLTGLTGGTRHGGTSNRDGNRAETSGNRAGTVTGIEVRADTPFGALARLAPVAIVQSDTAGRAVFVNERWCALTGLSQSQAVGSNWLDLLGPADRTRIERKMTAQYQPATGQPEIAIDVRLRPVAGQPVPARPTGPGPGFGGGAARGRPPRGHAGHVRRGRAQPGGRG